MAFSGDRTPRASGLPDRGPGSQRGSLVRRGQRSAMIVRRDVPSRLAGDSPSGAEASSGPSDTCRSSGCGVEEATGIPPAGTPGKRGRPLPKFYTAEQRRCAPRSSAKSSKERKALFWTSRDLRSRSVSIKSTPPFPPATLRVASGSVVGPLARAHGALASGDDPFERPALPRRCADRWRDHALRATDALAGTYG
ncbi:hypothetical protein Halru_0864 [Halovivax ruber XH-70]|uniref:Uncharacterized protein n=1 Tax=Halovivax ruber (strain DSM 18193 / JCM 13892 / XH-70) TaxID=797302 RepID=L0I9I9_HALRX|nr:hypothetical protein Halru_0864 [Halovivax ruber XH-70]